MIFVTGTKRSGTSLWMQIFKAAGYDIIGEEFPRDWADTIVSANPEGFLESTLRNGVYHKTNPHPKTGKYIFPQQSKRHVVKVFIPGLVRSDIGFIHRVVGTIRPWREYVTSLRRLYQIEDAAFSAKGLTSRQLERIRLQRGSLHPSLEWWDENYSLIRNFSVRRYPFNLVSFNKLLEQPTAVIAPVLEWCGGGDVEQAIAVVNKGLSTQKNVQVDDSPLSADQESLFDEFHHYFYTQQSLPKKFLQALNEMDRQVRSHITQIRNADSKSLQKMSKSSDESAS